MLPVLRVVLPYCASRRFHQTLSKLGLILGLHVGRVKFCIYKRQDALTQDRINPSIS